MKKNHVSRNKSYKNQVTSKKKKEIMSLVKNQVMSNKSKKNNVSSNKSKKYPQWGKKDYYI